MADEKVRKWGRINYVEPTNFFERMEGTREDAINFPYEDYNMAVDLSIRIADRYSCGWGKETGGEQVLNYSTNTGTISFLGGTRGYSSTDNEDDSYLTTNYTDVSMTSPGSNTSECLGIESISITYKSWFYPQVVVKFVDVRGATVMQPAESGYYNPNDNGNGRTLYKSLFTFPYPIFTLKVKGFYGKGVTYQLAVEKIQMDLDSTTGNFNITVSFIGYVFGIYADMPMTYLAVAPYTEEGMKYWRNNVENGSFTFRDSAGNVQCGMMTIPELRLKLAQAATSEEAVSVASEGERVRKNLDEQVEKTQALIDNWPLSGWYEPSGCPFMYKIERSPAVYDDFRTTVSGYVGNVSGYDRTYGTMYLSSMEPLVRYADKKSDIKNVYFVKDENGTFVPKDDKPWVGMGNIDYYNLYIKTYQSVLSYIAETVRDGQFFYVYVFPKFSADLNMGSVIGRLEDKINTISDTKTTQERAYREMQDAAIEKALGFRPSVKNIYDLVFAHMDTFMHVFYTMTKGIKDQLDGTNGAQKMYRSKTYYRISDGETDTENEKVIVNGAETVNINERSGYLPPFAAFYKEESVSEKNRSEGENKKVLRWPGELTNGTDLKEVNFVTDLLGAAELYGDRAGIVERIIKSMSSGTTGGNGAGPGGAPSADITGMIPLTTFDFIYKDRLPNPYDGVKLRIFKNEDGIEGEILGIFALRAYYYLCTNERNNSKEARGFGILEAINLFKSVGDRYSDSFIKFIRKYADGSNRGDERTDFINAITGTKGNYAWTDTSAVNLKPNLFINVNGGLMYCYHVMDIRNKVRCVMYPLHFTDFKSLRGKYAEGTESLLKDPSFLNVMDVEDAYGIYPEIAQTFFLYDSRDYIKDVFNSLETEVNEAKNYLETHKDEYGSRSGSEYGEVRKTNKTLKHYENNITESFDEKAYGTGIVVDSDGSNVSPKRVREIISEGTDEDIRGLYVKFPSMVDEDKGESVFETPIYMAQTDIRAKAFLFLQSVPVKGEGDRGGIDSKSTNGVSLKARLLREGSYYWRREESANDPTGDVIRYPERHIASYKHPAMDETFMGAKKGRNYETINMISATDRKREYIKWKEPDGTTPSRRRVLREYFERWATGTDDKSGFAANEARLRNEQLYSKDPAWYQREERADESTRTLAKGLDIRGLAGDNELQTFQAVEARKLQEFLRDLFFSIYTTLDVYDGIYVTDMGTGYEYLSCPESSMRDAFNGFMSELNAIYGRTVKDLEQKPEEYDRKAGQKAAANPFKNTDLRLSTYLTLKSLYDKWLCSPHNGAENTWRLSRISNSDLGYSGTNSLTESIAGRSDFDNFIYVDTFYHDIGYKLLVNITKVSSWLSSCLPTSNTESSEGLMQYTGRTVFEFLTEVAQDLGATLMALPSRFGLYRVDDIEKMFTPVSINDSWDEDTSSFIFMYSYKPSEHLGDYESQSCDMNGWSPNGDGLDLTDEELMGEMFRDDGYTVPSFAVTFAKQNQSIFKNITLNTENAGVTEAGLAATFNIAAKASESPRESTLYGQDLYRVFSQYAYQCGVDTMGNMQITPLMYFQLNNVPMWRGAYMIKSVSHTISAGNIQTHFDGLRMSRYAVPVADGAVITVKDTGDRGGSGSGGTGASPSAGAWGVSETGSDTLANPEFALSDRIDFSESNITPTKPIIALTPAHGPKTSKRREYYWSQSVVSKIAAILREYRFSDGTSYADNIQICNVGGKHTSSSGYSMFQTKQLINRYGSRQVISVVPHWNAGHGQYHMVMVNKASLGTRSDSMKLAECIRGEFEAVRNRRTEFSEPPVGMLDGDCRITPLGEKNTDGAPQLNCACVLTENWFVDYPYGCNWDSDGTYDSLGGDGRFLTGRGWLSSEEGIEAIAQAHAQGIRRYIETLS